jgi:PAS domain S-box-containing protein
MKNGTAPSHPSHSDKGSALPHEALCFQAEGDATLEAAQAAINSTTRLTRLLAILSEPAPIEQLLDRLLALLSELFSADIVVLLDPVGTGSFSPLAAIGLPEEVITAKFVSFNGSHVAKVMRTLKPVLTNHARTDPHIDPIFKHLHVETSVHLPLAGSHAGPRGILILARCHALPFSGADVDILTAMSYRIGLTLEQAQRNRQLEQIIQSSHEISRLLDESTVATETVRTFATIFKADAATLVVKNDKGLPVCVACSGLAPEQANVCVPVTESLLKDYLFAATRPYSTPDLYDTVKILSLRLPDNFPVHALMAIPVFRNNKAFGLLYGLRFSTTAFSPETLQLATLFTGQISVILENARFYKAANDELSVRKRTEHALRESDKRYRALIRSVSDIITILTVDGTILYSNPAVESFWKCTVDELIGQNILDRIHADDVATMRNLLSSVEPAATKEHLVRVRRGDNTWHDFEVTCTNLLTEQAVSGIVGTFRDVSKRKNR